jgi:hypothetical protein
VRLGIAGRRPPVLAYRRAVEQTEALFSFGERKPGACLRAVRTIAAIGSFIEIEVSLEADRTAVAAACVGLNGHERLLVIGCVLQPVADSRD